MGRTLLVIADQMALAREWQQRLASEDCRLRCCDEVAEGVRAIIDGGFDAVFLAHSAADFDPLGVLTRLRAASPATPVLVVSRCPSIETAVAAIKQGAADYLAEPCTPADLRLALDKLDAGAQRHPAGVPPAAGDANALPGFEGMLGRSPSMCEVFDLIARIAPADSTVLVSGQSGTGKEMVVRAIHRHSRRRDYPLLACDCTSLAPTLLESELFGHVKGSFSGAIATKKGLFEVAHQGTLMLDEVANLSQETQGKLLRVLETRRVRKVGDTAEQEVDIRLIATTNRSLAEMVKVGAFRADLYYRLNVVPITLPPLAERGPDIALLANVFIERFSRQMGVVAAGFSEEALRQMEIYPWPGNVRELRNIVERLAVLYGGTRIEFSHLPMEIREARPEASTMELPGTWEEFKAFKRRLVEQLERRFLTDALGRSGQNITQAAEAVGMQRPDFHALLRHHGLRSDPARERGAGS